MFIKDLEIHRLKGAKEYKSNITVITLHSISQAKGFLQLSYYQIKRWGGDGLISLNTSLKTSTQLQSRSQLPEIPSQHGRHDKASPVQNSPGQGDKSSPLRATQFPRGV